MAICPLTAPSAAAVVALRGDRLGARRRRAQRRGAGRGDLVAGRGLARVQAGLFFVEADDGGVEKGRRHAGVGGERLGVRERGGEEPRELRRGAVAVDVGLDGGLLHPALAGHDGAVLAADLAAQRDESPLGQSGQDVRLVVALAGDLFSLVVGRDQPGELGRLGARRLDLGVRRSARRARCRGRRGRAHAREHDRACDGREEPPQPHR